MTIATGQVALAADVNALLTKIRKTSDETVNNSTVLQNDNELLFAMAANEVWHVALIMIIDSSAVADFKFGFSLPAGATAHGYYIGHSSAGAAIQGALIQTSVSDLQGVGVGTGRNQAIVNLVVINGVNAGNFQLQWAQNTAEVSDTKLLTNSCITAGKVA